MKPFLPILLVTSLTAPLLAQEVLFSDPVARYGHNIMGNIPEWGQLCVDDRCLTLPEEQVFEDMAPRLIDLDFDGVSEIVVVESDVFSGASLAIYDLELNRIAATPPIGQSFRWLAPVGAVDIDHDGYMEFAYVDRPHLAKVLRIWRFKDGELINIANLEGFSNHAIGEEFITSAVRDCEGDRAFLVPSADRQNLRAVRFDEGFVVSEVSESDASHLEKSRTCD